MQMTKLDSGAFVDLTKVDAIYKHYQDGSNFMHVKVIVDGCDMVAKTIDVIKFADADAEATAYIDNLRAVRDKVLDKKYDLDRAHYEYLLGGFDTITRNWH